MTSWKILLSFAMLAIAYSLASNLDRMENSTKGIKDSWASKYLVKATDKIYYIETSLGANWYEANEICKFYNMRLATITNRNDNEILKNHLINNGWRDSNFWTSGNDLAKYGEFVWESTGEKFTFTDWGLKEPDHYINNGEIEHCVLVYWNDPGAQIAEKWNDRFCSYELWFICEF